MLTVFALSALTALGVRRHQALAQYKKDYLAIMLMHLSTRDRLSPSIKVVSYIGDRDAGQIGRCIKHGDRVWIEVTVAKPTFPLYSYSGIVICNRLDNDQLLSVADYNQIADRHPGMDRLNIPKRGITM